jgi:circadian clock protein KaiC
LDEVLGGGIQRGSLAIIAGPPGGGKTILAHQIAFTAARAGRRTTILTAFSEPTNKLIAHMRPFTFFDQDLLGQSLNVLSMQQFLRDGLDDAVGDMVAAVRAAKANLVVLDGFRGVRETAEHPEDARRFIYEVSNRLSLLGVTLLLTSEANVRDVTFFPEATTADVLLGLAFDAIGARERRTLEVLKVRGAAPLPGWHTLTISDDGVTIYPRIEARVARQIGMPRSLVAQYVRGAPREEPAGQQDADAPVTTGVPGLNPLLDGGLSRGSSTLVVGARGVGKTLLSLQFALEGARVGEPCLFVSFRETADQLARKTTPFGWGGAFQEALDSGALTILRTPPVELHADVLADILVARLDETGARRLVVDEVGELERALVASGYAHRFHDFAAALVESFRLRGVTALLTRQTAADDRSALEQRIVPLTLLTENLLWMREWSSNGRIVRSLEILQTAISGRTEVSHPMIVEAPGGIIIQHQNDQRDVAGKTESNARGRGARQTHDPGEEGRDDNR